MDIRVKEVIEKYKTYIDNILEDLSMSKLGYEGYEEQANRRILQLKEKAGLDDDTFKKLHRYLYKQS